MTEIYLSMRHQCPEWDYMEIGPEDAEFAACSCFAGYPEADAASDARQKELDEHNERTASKPGAAK